MLTGCTKDGYKDTTAAHLEVNGGQFYSFWPCAGYEQNFLHVVIYRLETLVVRVNVLRTLN